MTNSLVVMLKNSNSYLIKAGNITQLLLLLFFRFNWGYLFFETGKGKLINHTQVVGFFSSLNLPAPDATAWFVGIVECLGGLLLLLGLATRSVGLILSINMIVAYLSVDEDRNKLLGFFKDQDAFFHADPFFFLLSAVVAFAFGGGPISIDALLKKFIAKKFEFHQSD